MGHAIFLKLLYNGISLITIIQQFLPEKIIGNQAFTQAFDNNMYGMKVYILKLFCLH